jgi:hypothetical protein
MSNALAIASVTAVLRNLLNNGLVDKDPAGTLGDFSVTALPPDRILKDKPESEANQLNLFLYRVTPNSGWRNAGLPSRAPGGELLTNPPLALDLHYLLTAYATENLGAEILLGYAMQVLHETPLLGRDAIRAALAGNGAGPVSGQVLPPALRTLSAAELADQFEMLKITPEFMNTEEMSKLWSALQTHYRPTAVYQVSVVLIEGKKPTRPTLPVRERNLYAVPVSQPRVHAVEAGSGPLDPILPGGTLVIKGERLRGHVTKVLIDGAVFTPALNDIADRQVVLPVPAALRAGIRALQIAHDLSLGTPPAPHRGVESNVAAFLLRPTITVPASAQAAVAITLSPRVGKTQRVKLLLGETPPPPARPARGYVLDAPARNGVAEGEDDTASIAFPLAGVAVGDYLVRAQVDGAESLLEAETDGSLIGPKLTVT